LAAAGVGGGVVPLFDRAGVAGGRAGDFASIAPDAVEPDAVAPDEVAPDDIAPDA
jgi:hypothetical protein